MRTRERRKTVGGKIQNYTPPTTIQDHLVVIDVSTESSVSPVNMFRTGGSFNFQVKSNLGLPITITGIDVPGGDALVNAVPFTINNSPTTVNFTGFSSGDFVIHHNGLNTPFTVNIILGS